VICGANEVTPMKAFSNWALMLLLLAALPAIADTPTAPEVTLRGEIVDLHCYLTRGAKGPDHAACANACILRSVSPGFLADDGRLFLLLEERPVSVKDRIADLAGASVTVKGVPVERAGLRGLQVKSIEKS
jgi:hypothetical protein